MATRVFEAGIAHIVKLGIDNLTLKAAMLMSNTNAGSAADTGISFVSDLTLDEYDGTTYARQAAAGVAVAHDDADGRAEIDANDIDWGTPGDTTPGTRQVKGVLLYSEVADDDDSVPLAFYEFSPLKTPDGSAFVTPVNSEGLMHGTPA